MSGDEVILGTIAYLDSQEVDNLLASIEGGLVEQFRETRRDVRAKRGEGGIALPATAIGVKGGLESMREEASEALKKTTPVSRLSTLRKILLEQDYVQYINTVTQNLHDELREGQLVEVHGKISVSAFTELVELGVRFLEIASKFGTVFGGSLEIDEETAELIKYLEYVSSKGIPLYISVPQAPDVKRGFDFACSLSPEKLLVSTDDLEGIFNVLARVKNVLAKNEVRYLYELIPGMSRLPGKELKALIKQMTKKSGKGFPFELTEKDLRLRYPTIILSPIAMYS